MNHAYDAGCKNDDKKRFCELGDHGVSASDVRCGETKQQRKHAAIFVYCGLDRE